MVNFAQKKSGPLIFIGVPAHTRASSGAQFYRTPSELSTVYGVRTDREFIISNIVNVIKITIISVWPCMHAVRSL